MSSSDAGNRTPVPYETLWRNKWLTAEAASIEEMVSMLRAAADRLDAMRAAGVTLAEESLSSVADDYARLVTFDPKVAALFGMEIDEFLYEGEEEEEEDDSYHGGE